MIQVSKPYIGEQELKEIEKVFATGWLGMGIWVKDFETKVADYLGCKEVIATNTGTTAIHLALDVLDLKPGDEVIVPSLTFIATIQAVMQAGGTPVFCDVERDTLNLSLEDVKRKLSSKTRVILPVHYRGQPCDMDGLLELAEKHQLVIVEDAAHAFGSDYRSGGKSRKIGSFGHLTCFSFDPIKVITTGEGGAVCTPNSTWAERMRKKRILGIDKDTWSRYRHERAWFYDVTEKGFRYHMSNINAAIGVKQMDQVESFKARRVEIAKRYDEFFGASFFKGKLELLRTDYEGIALFTYIVRIVDGKRDALMDYLKSKQITSGVHYIPNHQQSICKPFPAESLTVTESVAEQILTLPLYVGLSDEEVGKVMAAVKGFWQ